jgi:hypothetical protein
MSLAGAVPKIRDSPFRYSNGMVGVIAPFSPLCYFLGGYPKAADLTADLTN